ncbi:hypothetical protein NQ315_002505 [Exocentrus adspersus]|uniref:30S ribosomal protein S15 n=1 Tax=Exocentrus adspersus TaxID=1586481 RepID=A0AAV8VME4_9CUCU|nr:hypothetical protein NQ315_002505 [Exocentrus adspersus]
MIFLFSKLMLRGTYKAEAESAETSNTKGLQNYRERHDRLIMILKRYEILKDYTRRKAHGIH